MKSFKKIAAMIMAVAMLCSFTALAVSDISITAIDDITVSAPGVDSTFNIKFDSEAAQNSVLVYQGTSLNDADVFYIDQVAPAVGEVGIELTLDADDTKGNYVVMVGGTGVAEAAVEEFEYIDDIPKYKVEINGSEFGEVSYTGASEGLDANASVELTFAPKLGYEIDDISVKVGDADAETKTIDDDDTYTLTVTGNTVITPNFKRVVATAENPRTYNKVFDVDASYGDDDRPGQTALASKILFAQAAGEGIVEMGMYVEKYDETEGRFVEFKTTGDENYGPYFAAADGRWTANKEFGIRFFGFTGGRYQIKSYVKYEGQQEPKFGDPVEFIVG